jgi:hypothetical protein
VCTFPQLIFKEEMRQMTPPSFEEIEEADLCTFPQLIFKEEMRRHHRLFEEIDKWRWGAY